MTEQRAREPGCDDEPAAEERRSRANGAEPQHWNEHPLDWKALSQRVPPIRDWAVPDWLPMGHSTLLAGRGGIGKTLLAQTLGTCLALGHDYFEETPAPARVLMWAGEDDHDELWRRQLDICRWLGIDLAQLADRLTLFSYIDRDITLASLVFGALEPTPAMGLLREQVGDLRTEFVFLDSVARIYGGSENDRHQVTQFLTWTRAACGRSGLCLLGHPGKAMDSEYSGSTAWEGSVRARLYLADRLPDGDPRDSDDEPDPSIRYLSRRKANYSDKDWRRFEYRDGVLVPDSTPRAGRCGEQFAQDAVLRAVRKLKERDLYGTLATNQASYLPRLAQQYGLLDGVPKATFTKAMRALVMMGRLKMDTVGRYANRTPKPGLVEVS